MAIGNEIFGRPTLLDIQNRAAGNAAFVVTEAILRASPLLQAMPFVTSRDLAFVYKRRQLARVGQLRALNTDYAPKFAGGDTQHTTNLAILGDAYEWDRVLGAVDPSQIEAQIQAMAPGIGNRFADLLINGNRTANALEFDGLSTIAEAIGGEAVQTGLDLTLDTASSTQVDFRRNLGKVTAAVRRMSALGYRPVVMGNLAVAAALDLAGDLLGYAARTPDAFGNGQITTIAGAPFIDTGMANVYGTPTVVDGRTVYPVEQREIIPTVTGATDLYVVGLSAAGGVTGVTLDGFDGRAPVRFQTARTDAGAVHRAEMEAVLGVAVLDDRAVIKFSDVVVE